MKKFWFYLIIGLLCLQTSVYAQCTPDLTITQPGIYPDSLPPADVGIAYSQTLQVKVLTDTMTSLGLATIDHIQIVSIAGIPAGFTYGCVPNNCQFPGGSNGCIVFSGLAVSGQEGSYPLTITIDVTATVTIGGFPIQSTQTETLNDYVFIIDGPLSVGWAKGKSLELKPNFPNPAVSKTSIDYIVPTAAIAEFRLFNVLGKELLNKNFKAKPGKNTIELDVREFEDGIYMYSIKTGNTVMTRRMVISRKQ
jgi:hypothetical protein